MEARDTPAADRLAAELRGFGPLGILAILVVLVAGIIMLGPIAVPLGGILVLVWARVTNTPWREIGYVRPRSWLGGAAIGVAAGCAFKLLMKAAVMPLLGADPINHAYHALAGNSALLPAAGLAMLAAGFGEETVFRGYMFERLGKLLGSGAGAKPRWCSSPRRSSPRCTITTKGSPAPNRRSLPGSRSARFLRSRGGCGG